MSSPMSIGCGMSFQNVLGFLRQHIVHVPIIAHTLVVALAPALASRVHTSTAQMLVSILFSIMMVHSDNLDVTTILVLCHRILYLTVNV